MYNEVVHLKPVDLREVWPNEADNFTPWLEEPEHLSWLGEALNMKLADAKREVNVGQFRADIMCSNTADDSVVVIENQYGESDHDLLGKVLTYGIGLEARTLVWVAESFTNEHLAVINRLNAMRDENFQFFGVAVKVTEIPNSLYGVQFSVVAKPDDDICSAVINDDCSAVINDDWREQFFAEFRRHLTANGSQLNRLEWNRNSPDYLGFDIGRWPEIWLSGWISAPQRQIAANLHMKGSNAVSLFDELKNNRQEIESQFGAGLQWKKSPPWNREGAQVGVYYNTDPTGRSDWPNQFKWLRSNLEKLNEIFGPRINGGTHGNTQTEPN